MASSIRWPPFIDEENSEESFPAFGNSFEPLHDILINALSYSMWGHKYDVDLMSAFATKIGKVKLMERLTQDGVTDMEEVVKQLLTAWRIAVDASEENLARFLRGFPEFEKCVLLLDDYKKQHKMQRLMSDTNLLESNLDRDGMRASLTRQAPRLQQVLKKNQASNHQGQEMTR